MTTYLHELYAHQEWADAEHWRAFEEYSSALADKAIRERLHHIHAVQHAFLWMTGPRTTEFKFRGFDEFPSTPELKAFAREYHVGAADVLRNLSEKTTEEMLDAPWFSKPTSINRRHALTQAAMHSHYHRGQNATRLRELGGVPPTTDFIIWLREGQPRPRWTE